MTWNIEGLTSSRSSLRHFVDIYSPDLIFLSEPQIFQCDIPSMTTFLSGQYSSALSSEDLFDNDLPFTKRKARGGSMIIWKTEYTPFIEKLPPPSPSMQPIIFSPPGALPSIHIAVYLPTAGRDTEYVEELSHLQHLLSHFSSVYPRFPVYVRGDMNTNPKNKMRKNI